MINVRWGREALAIFENLLLKYKCILDVSQLKFSQKFKSLFIISS